MADRSGAVRNVCFGPLLQRLTVFKLVPSDICVAG